MDLDHLFYFVDSLCVFLDRRIFAPRSSSPGPKPLHPSELITLLLLHQLQQYKTFKAFYTKHALLYLRKDFPHMPSYPCFVAQLPRVAPYLFALSRVLCGSCTGKTFLDSTLLRVCQPVRASRHRLFHDKAKWGKNTKGWVYGLKLHLAINEHRVLLCYRITPANVDDRKPVRDMLRGLFGKVYADKGYLSKKLSEDVRREGIELITRLKKGMKGELLLREDAQGLYERSKVETVISLLKNRYEIEHTRHRSQRNALIHIMTALLSYNLFSSHASLAPELPDIGRVLGAAA